MTAPDPLAVRLYQSQLVRHQGNARSDFASIQSKVESLTDDQATEENTDG